jgi:hypothetical protein
MDEDEIDRLLEKALGPPPGTPQAPRVTARVLDDLLASRTHVRVLRVLVAFDRRTNLSARDVSRRADASHGRVLEVLGQLSSLGLVHIYRTPSYAIYRLIEEHPLAAAVRSLFDEERRSGDQVSAPTRTLP